MIERRTHIQCPRAMSRMDVAFLSHLKQAGTFTKADFLASIQPPLTSEYARKRLSDWIKQGRVIKTRDYRLRLMGNI
jgi:hypothetical protein